MTNDHNKHSNRTNGYYKTPEKTVEYIANKIKLKIKEGIKVLDPAVGDGVFLQKLSQLGINKKQLFGHDINPEVIEDLKREFPNIFLKDSLLEEYERFDIIIGNPPYNSNECDYIKENRKVLKKKFGKIGAINLYPLFIHEGIERLKEGGTLCMIVLDSFLTNIYYKPLREYILNTCRISEILLAPWRLFHDQKADVRTAIITLEKCSGIEKLEKREDNKMILIDRVFNEDEYLFPSKKTELNQIEFNKMPDKIFFVGTAPSIINLIKSSNLTVGDVSGGGTGISTGNDKRFLRRKSEVEGNPNWTGFFKSGKRNPYYYETNFYIEKDWKRNSKLSKTFMIRNKDYFFREGITCSSVGLKFNASYMPEGNLFGVNTNLFCKSKEDLFYLLGFLNSKVAQYISRQVINRTNNISARYVKMIPYLEPKDEKIKNKISDIVKGIVEEMMKNQNFDFSEKQKVLDDLFFDIYQVDEKDKEKINDFCENIFERI